MTDNENKKFENIKDQIKDIPASPGLYFMKDKADTVLYIGKAKNLRSRVASYFQDSANIEETRGPKIVEMLNQVESIGHMETETEVDALLKEARLIKDIRPPYNTDLVDSKTFPYLEITKNEDFPRIHVTRKPREKGTKLFGPFPGARELRQVIVELQRIYKFRTCTLDIDENNDKRRFFRPCILYSIKQCTAPCAAKVSKKDYRKQVTDLIRFLGSKRSTVLKKLNREMKKAAKELNYEEAASIRDKIHLIEKLDERGIPEENVQPEAFASDPTSALLKLQDIIGADEPVRIIEGIDIAHLSGKETVGSLVKFIDGRPFKSGYRRFKIKTVEGIDDFASIYEVVKRRYKYAIKGEELWPDLILIDGGLGQLHAAQKALKDLGAPELKLASIAKKEEHIYLKGKDEPIRMAPYNSARKLLQFVRDEAHRFAQHYHHILRSKNMLE